MKKLLLFTTAASMPAVLSAAPPASAAYAIPALTLDAGGGVAASANYAAVTGNGEPGMLTTSPGLTAKPGFTGQLYDVTALEITAPSTTILEATSQQLGSTATLDDASLLLPDPAQLRWQVRSGPIVSITNAGLATAGNVYQNTPAQVQGTWLGVSGTLDFTIRNTGDDDYLGYGSDGISDLWQVAYFGEQSPFGFATADPDGDGEDNLFEFLTGYLPNDATSLLTARHLSLTGSTATLELSRVQPGVVYQIETSSDLITWAPLLNLAPGFLLEPFSQALPATGPRAFYRVKVTAAP